MPVTKASTSTIVLCGVGVFFLWATVQLSFFALADIFDYIGQSKSESRDFRAAESFFARSVGLIPSKSDYLLHHGDALYNLATQETDENAARKLLQTALQAYRKTTELTPREGNAWYGLGQTLWWLSSFKGLQGRIGEIEPLFLRALEIDRNNGKFLYAIIDYYLSIGKPDAEIIEYVERLACSYPDAWNGLRKHSGWNGELQEHFTQGLETAASNRLTEYPALSILAFSAAEAGDWNAATRYLEQLMRQGEGRDPIPLSSYVDLGYYRLKTRSLSEAKSAYMQALRLAKDRSTALDNLMWRLEKSGAVELYLDLVKEVSSFDAEVSANASQIRGKAYFYIAKDLESAEACFRHSLRMRETAVAHGYLAEIFMMRKEWDKSELESHRAVMLDPRDSSLRFLFARSLYEQQRYVPALEAVGVAIRSSGGRNASYFNLQGWINWCLHDYNGAVKSWESARQIAPNDAAYTRQIGHAYYMLKDFATAERFYLAALKLDPGNTSIENELQALRARSGRANSN